MNVNCSASLFKNTCQFSRCVLNHPFQNIALHLIKKRINNPSNINYENLRYCVSGLNSLCQLTYEGCSKKSDRSLVVLSKVIFERHNMHHSKELSFTVIRMLIFSRCTVAFIIYGPLHTTDLFSC